MLAAATILVELKTAFSIPFIRRLIEKFTVVGIALSIGLSLLIGGLFGATGVVVMMGAMIATSFTQPVYMVAAKVKHTGHDVAHTVEEVKSVVRPFANLFKLAFKIMALPFIIVFKIVKFFDHITNKETVKVTT